MPLPLVFDRLDALREELEVLELVREDEERTLMFESEEAEVPPGLTTVPGGPSSCLRSLKFRIDFSKPPLRQR